MEAEVGGPLSAGVAEWTSCATVGTAHALDRVTRFTACLTVAVWPPLRARDSERAADRAWDARGTLRP
jgi:hypothetical protein